MAIYKVKEQELYKKSLKKLSKSYSNIDKDINNFLESIQSKKDLGVELKSNIFKVRIANSNKNRGESAGYRLISYLLIVKEELHLLYIYDKSQLSNLTENQLDEIILKQIEKE